MAIYQDRVIRLRKVLERTGLSRSTLYRNINLGTFPAPVKISARCAGWRESTIDKWIDSRGEKADNPSQMIERIN